MSLKRKASFPSLESQHAASNFARGTWQMKETPQHLNSRTRKRFRNDRPEEKVVYENTLRWLFTAQQQQSSASLASLADGDEQMEHEPTLSPETVDPRQQTLLKFFRPSQSSSNKPLHNSAMPKTSDASFVNAAPVHLLNMHTSSPGESMGSSTFGSASETTSTDMDVDMDSASEESNYPSRGSAGGLAWMGHPRF
ncbi:uncharacterized protein BP01DRAFT_353396 [Aspergillus saccharolyticus JOP 1030-1]|uniref:Uncharacterized protein n=1 Tax=Aspergillus saccharolyticus JOP 1030-1 TaxID=1450539 RepID=A0A319AS11_9EURO|nr:hypothetical protein BP01DRAFT_353396 [Aspergillus saccharolyticus JOP 1030-1]PYH49072.1 hypothetical protein BP01DRAFT_353396 [Aspergillus saccharolyticus JOP 1030-1]